MNEAPQRSFEGTAPPLADRLVTSEAASILAAGLMSSAKDQ